MAAIRYWVWLSSQTGVSAGARKLLVEHYGDAQRAFFAPEGEYARIPGISDSDAKQLEQRDMRCVDKILAACDEQGIDIIALNDSRYPARLRNIPDAPTVLYVKGRLPNVDTDPAVAVIGTRQASPYGLKMGKSMAYEISKCGGAVISLLTVGIDEYAAQGCLLAGGKCIAVLGTAHEDCRHRLCEDIAHSGAVVSEYAPGTKQMKSFFRARNRIASGLSAGVVVVEAPKDSKTLLFAAQAQEQGREVFAVPGNADSANSVGTIELIKAGAAAVVCGWDVMEELEPMFPGKVRNAVSQPCPEEETAKIEKSKEKKEIDSKKNKAYKDKDKAGDKDNTDLKKQLSELSDEQLCIVTAIDRDGSHIDDIIESTGLGAGKVLSQLTILEIKGYIKRAPGRRVTLNIR